MINDHIAWRTEMSGYFGNRSSSNPEIAPKVSTDAA
jgi:hypothetical protein